ncbi:antitoxin MazE family protein [Beijerinckia sp. L45]|uniref:antitoxin MazE family protein n=1 Tax=Beijerinckia sp. L45 TaxID=1641855 RepID=UPI001FEE99E9|nr:antitoxin MazE family protein [Beijerinckia sp. L45]
MSTYRAKMRAAGLRPVQIWVPDTAAPGFIETCRRQAAAIAADDPAGDALLDWIEATYDWPA